MRKFLIILGTRPEAIKFAPLIREMQKHTADFEVKICISGQHLTMLKQVLDFFEIQPDFNLELMRPDQTLSDLTADGLQKLRKIFAEFYRPDYVIVQGDTTTAMVGALASFYDKIPVIHLEAGLRSGDIYSPYPEEVNRLLICRLASWHLAPTNQSKVNLLKENIREEQILLCGNTVIDSLQLGLQIIHQSNDALYKEKFCFLDFDKMIILVTGHRRENFGKPFISICEALKELAALFPHIQIVYPVHLNPNVREVVYRMLDGVPNIFLTAPLEYNFLIWLMEKCHFILTDSGGIQEEAPALGKPVLVLRNVTERTEGIEAGTAKIVGTDKDTIVKEASALIYSNEVYLRMANAVNPYGDGTTSKQIVKFILAELIANKDKEQPEYA